MITLSVPGMEVDFDPSLGIVTALRVEDGGRILSPLHRAPWVGLEDMPPGTDPHLAKLGGDFFCAPFGADDNGSGLHGWPPNSAWKVIDQTDGFLRARLIRRVKGATLTKELRLHPPFLLQRHIFEGGAGEVPVSNHANVALPQGGLIATSRKSRWETPASAPEPDPARGRSCLAYPAKAEDPSQFPGRDGPVDLTTYPWGPAHEDFAIGIEAETALGWTAVSRLGQADAFLSLRDPRQLPMTMLWHSNGGRDYAPWSSRHTGCLGIEEGAAGHMRAEPGPPALTLGGAHHIDHCIGAIAWPEGERVEAVSKDKGGLVVTGTRGTSRVLHRPKTSANRDYVKLEPPQRLT
ncbi:MAG: hypothetical protein AAF618_11640 [Pseudomonadota bacterium]